MADIRIKDLATTATTSASDDYLALDGSTNGTRKILATNVANNVTDVVFGASGPSAKSSIAARAARQGLVFDGTAGATVSVPAFGTSNFTVIAFINPVSVSNNPYILAGADSTSFSLRVLSGGTARTGLTNGTINTASTSTLTLGKFNVVAYVRSSTTGAYYFDGIAGGTTTDSSNYSTSITKISGDAGGAFILNGTASILIYNRALSAAEVVSLYEAGVPAGADYNNASNTSSIISGNDSDFSGAGTWTTFNTATASVTGGKLVVSGVASGTSGVRRVPPSASIYIGRRYRLSFTISGSNGTFVVGYLGAGNTVTNISTVSGNGTFTHEFTADRSWTNFGDIVFINGGGTATAFEVDNVTMFPLGLLLAPDAAQSGGGLAWYDTSGNAANITLPATGVTWNVPTSGYLTSSSSLNLRAGGTNQNITLTPSGTGTTANMGGGYFTGSGVMPNGSAGGIEITCDNTSGNVFAYRRGVGALPLILQGAGSNVLIGTSVNSGALLQVGTNTTTSAGGMVFGTDNNLFRYNSNQLALTNSSGTSGSAIASNIQLRIENSGNGGLQVNVPDASTGGVYFGRASDAYYTAIERSGTNLQLRNAGATALTIASTGAATFAGAVTLASSNPSLTLSGTSGKLLLTDTGVGSTSRNWAIGYSQAAEGDFLIMVSTAAGGDPILGTTALGFDRTGAATFASTVSVTGALKLGNAYVAGAVVGTGYVTIQDSTGTTYRVPVLV